MDYIYRYEHARTDHANGIYQNIFFAGENDTRDSQNYRNKLKPGGMMDVVEELRYELLHYSASATTSLTSGIMRFIMPSIPAFSVIMEEGQPEQDPCSMRFRTPSL